MYPPSPILINICTTRLDVSSKIYPIKISNIEAESKETLSPFLYTPFTESKISKKQNYFSVNEPIEFLLTFANPFTITIQIQKISLM